jgi:hypothetical protein
VSGNNLRLDQYSEAERKVDILFLLKYVVGRKAAQGMVIDSDKAK